MSSESSNGRQIVISNGLKEPVTDMVVIGNGLKEPVTDRAVSVLDTEPTTGYPK